MAILSGMSRGLRGITGSPFRIGLALVVVTVTAVVGLFCKQQITTTLAFGDTITVQFHRAYRLRPYESEAKISGVDVGTVTGVELLDNDMTEVSVKLDPGIVEKLGAEPSAAIRPTTVLGGNYYVDLTVDRTGEFDGPIPAARTSTPVELDHIVNDLQPDTLESAQRLVPRFGNTLNRHTRAAVDKLLAHAPANLESADNVFRALQGTRPRTDLAKMVASFESTSAVLTAQQGQLDSIVQDMSTTARVFGNRSADLRRAFDGMPRTLHVTRAGLVDLDSSLVALRDSSDEMRPLVRQLDSTLAHLDPMLVTARPAVRDLRFMFKQARPVTKDLVPVTRGLTTTLDHFGDPVMARFTGPITDMVLREWHGNGPYAGGGADRPFYKEFGYLVSNLSGAMAMTDELGATFGANDGYAPATVDGLSPSLPGLLDQLARMSEGGSR
jgi:phospholipid/cholesterol/gamma-HCH transport system substrate-binding protein